MTARRGLGWRREVLGPGPHAVALVSGREPPPGSGDPKRAPLGVELAAGPAGGEAKPGLRACGRVGAGGKAVRVVPLRWTG